MLAQLAASDLAVKSPAHQLSQDVQSLELVSLQAVVLTVLCMLSFSGRCRQLQRCFEVLDLMTNAGIPSDDITFTCLIEAAVLAGEVEIAQRVFARAMAAGINSSVQV